MPAVHLGSIYRSVLPTMYKKLIENLLDILFDRLDQCSIRVVTSVAHLMLAVYPHVPPPVPGCAGQWASMFRVTPARWERDRRRRHVLAGR